MRHWVEEDNTGVAQILGIRCLTREKQKGREAGAVAGYLPEGKDRSQPGASHGKEALPHHRVRLGQMRVFPPALFLISTCPVMSFYHLSAGISPLAGVSSD